MTEPKPQAYSLASVKRAFWATFHKDGEVWFDHLGTDEECERSTNTEWEFFLENLEKEAQVSAGVQNLWWTRDARRLHERVSAIEERSEEQTKRALEQTEQALGISARLGARIGMMMPYLRTLLDGAELAHPWPAQVVEDLGGVERLRKLLTNPLGKNDA